MAKNCRQHGYKVSLKSAFNWVKQRFGHQPPAAEHVTVSSEAHAKTSDNVFVAIPFRLELKIADQTKYRLDNYKPDDQVALLADMAFKTEVAGTTYMDLLKSPDGLAGAVLASTQSLIQQNYGLILESIVAEKVRGPAIPEPDVKAIEEAVAEAREKAKVLIEAHISSRDLVKGLDTEIQVRKPLSLKKSGQQP